CGAGWCRSSSRTRTRSRRERGTRTAGRTAETHSSWVLSSASGAGRAVGVEGVRGDRVRVRVARLPQRLRGAQALLLGREEPLVLVETDRAQLEVHHRVVGAAQLGAPPDVGPLL